MNYRSFADLQDCVLANLHRLPRGLDLVVGIPRSGLVAAGMIALTLNLPLADLDGLLAGRLLIHDRFRRANPGFRTAVAECRQVLVVDDSVLTGASMARARQRIEAASFGKSVTYAAVYGTGEPAPGIDLVFETVPTPRMFQWNLMHHWHLKQCCVEIDGVLCRPPTETECLDAGRYAGFVETAEPFLVPTLPVGIIVTARAEAHRAATVAWLRRMNIAYGRLVMLGRAPLPDAAVAGRLKGEFYRQTGAVLFIENGPLQSSDIARTAAKPVLCTRTQRIFDPAG